MLIIIITCTPQGTLTLDFSLLSLSPQSTTQKPNTHKQQKQQKQKQGAWRTDEIRRQKPTPQDEMRQGLAYFHETIFKGLPTFLRRIDTALGNIGQPMLPLDATPFRFGSWMGGDRDGNPFVTPETTRDCVLTARLSAVNLYFQQVQKLMFDLSAWRASKAVQQRAEQVGVLLGGCLFWGWEWCWLWW